MKQSLLKKKWICRTGVPFLFLLGFPLWAQSPPATLPPKKSPVQSKNTENTPPLDEIQITAEALDFFSREGDEMALSSLTKRVLAQKWMHSLLMQKVLEIAIEQKNRDLIYRHWFSFFEKNSCAQFEQKGLSPSEGCIFLKRLWQENLETLSFYEDSAPKLEAARRALAGKDCRLAQTITDQVRGREGVFPQLLRLQIKSVVCQKDKASANTLKSELAKLQPYPSIE